MRAQTQKKTKRYDTVHKVPQKRVSWKRENGTGKPLKLATQIW